MTVLDSYAFTNYSSDYGFAAYPADNGAFYQSFKTPNDGVSYKLTSITLMVPKGEGVSCTLQVEIYAHTGTYGTSSAPTGSALATSDVNDQDDISSVNGQSIFTFTGANQITLTPNTAYVFVIKCLTLSGGVLALSLDSTTPTHAGNAGAWTSA